MAFAEGDIDNDGRFELFAADMKPYRAGPDVDAAWAPVLPPDAAASDREQIYANTLQVRGADGGFENRAAGAGVDATGWSWSAQFGDLDNDGDLDLYTVNGMIGEAFGHLPGAELVEENQALRNDGSGVFTPAPQWGIGATESGRGMALADLDLDGDLDIVVNNFAAPAMLFENQVCGGTSLEVDLRWPRIGQPVRRGIEAGSDHRAHDLLAPDAGRQRLPVERPAARTLRLAARRTPADAVGGVARRKYQYGR